MVFNFHFNAPVGQQIAHVDKIEAHFDKEEQMQVVGNNVVSGTENASAEKVVENLARYFNASFRGRNMSRTDYLPILVEDIRDYNKAKDHARIANMIYNSKEMINRPSSFAQWYRTFCDLCGLCHKSYDQNKVDDYIGMKPKFYYLSF